MDKTENRGRKTKISDKIIASMYEQVRKGIPATRACAVVGISTSVYYSWLVKAREAIEKAKNDPDKLDNNLYVELLDTVARAEGELIAEGLKSIKSEGPAGWKWLLARLFRKEFGDQQQLVADLGNVKLQLELPNMVTPGDNNKPDDQLLSVGTIQETVEHD